MSTGYDLNYNNRANTSSYNYSGDMAASYNSNYQNPYGAPYNSGYPSQYPTLYGQPGYNTTGMIPGNPNSSYNIAKGVESQPAANPGFQYPGSYPTDLN